MTERLLTFTGKEIDYDIDPSPMSFCVEDIAHALSNICRFAGQCRTFYSVGQHSVHVAENIEGMGEQREMILAGLLHDAAEAYLVDVPRPLKRLLPEYEAIEQRFRRTIEFRFNLPRFILEDPVVKEADQRMLCTEGRDLLGRTNTEWCGGGLVYPDFEIVPCPPEQVEIAFLTMFREYGGC